MNYRVTHATIYRYSKMVSLCHNLVHLTPRTEGRQTCWQTQREVKPVPTLMRDQTDFFGNRTTYITIEEPHDALTVKAVSRVKVAAAIAPDPAATPPWEEVRAALEHDRQPRRVWRRGSSSSTRPTYGRVRSWPITPPPASRPAGRCWTRRST